MDSDNWWKIYLDTVYQNEDDLQEYMRAYDQGQNSDAQERLRELRGETGTFTAPLTETRSVDQIKNLWRAKISSFYCHFFFSI